MRIKTLSAISNSTHILYFPVTKLVVATEIIVRLTTMARLALVIYINSEVI